MTVFDDLAAQQERLESILVGLDETQWASASGGRGRAAGMVRAQRQEDASARVVFERWQRARLAALAALRGTDQDKSVA
jgi:hypothetical protein